MNSLPVFGWIISLVFTASSAFPFWLIWTHWGFGRLYFYWLPPVYYDLPFLHCVGLFTVIGILMRICAPRLAYVSQTNNNKKKEKKTKEDNNESAG